jgi:hypothetical protein
VNGDPDALVVLDARARWIRCLRVGRRITSWATVYYLLARLRTRQETDRACPQKRQGVMALPIMGHTPILQLLLRCTSPPVVNVPLLRRVAAAGSSS